MKEIEVPYIITIYDFSSDPYTTKVIKGRKCFDGNELFPKIIKDIVREHSININEQIYIENLKEITWGENNK